MHFRPTVRRNFLRLSATKFVAAAFSSFSNYFYLIGSLKINIHNEMNLAGIANSKKKHRKTVKKKQHKKKYQKPVKKKKQHND